MKKNIIKIFTVLAVVSTVAVSCDDYLDVNDSPNSPLASQIPPNQRLQAAQTQMHRAITGDARTTSADIRSNSFNQLGSIWTNAWAGNSNSTTGAMADEYTVSLNASFYDAIWDYSYRNLTNLHSITQYDSDDYDNHKAIAMILKSFYMQYIVDLYGDAPYAEAFLGQDNITPAYDDDRDIYRALVDNLDAAVALIGSADSNDKLVGSEDVMLAGNMNSWVSFANTIKLRLLIRQSGLASEQTYIESELDELSGAIFITSDVTINPGFDNTATEKQNPFYARYGYNISGGALTNRSYIVATSHAASILNGTVTGVVDPRRSRLFTLQGGQVVGITQGEDGTTAPDNVSLLGPAIVPTNTVIGSAMDGYVMTLSEAKFLLSEAALKYPSKFAGYDPQTLFNEGIDASFVRLGAGSSAAYIASIDAVSGYGWSASADKVQAIMTQKWIALMHIHGIESWIDYLRTGFPSSPLPLTNTTGLPKRLMYPTSELGGNSANVPSQTVASAFATGPFWLL